MVGDNICTAWCNYGAGTYPDSDRDEGEPVARNDEKSA